MPAKDAWCPMPERASTGAQPSAEAIEVLTSHLQAEWAGPYMARIRDFTDEEVEAGELRAANERAHEDAKAEAKVGLTAALAIDAPAIHAAGVQEGRAAMLREVVESVRGLAATADDDGPLGRHTSRAFTIAADAIEARFPSEGTT